ncbi:MAG: hypothetical protein DME67_02570, partial [Verrucomicrobia bacterium]
REPLRIGRKRYTVERMNGWYQIEFRELGARKHRMFNLDELVRFADTKKKPSTTRSKRKAIKARRRK